MYRFTDIEVRLAQNNDLLRESHQYRLVKEAESGDPYRGVPTRRESWLAARERSARGWLAAAVSRLSPGLACRLNLSPC